MLKQFEHMKGVRFRQVLGHKETMQFFCFARGETDFAARWDHAGNQIGAQRCLHL